MKNLFKTLAIVAMGLFATSCATDLTDDVAVGTGDVEVSFTTGLPSRAISDGSQATKLYVQAYAVQGTGLQKAAYAEADVVGLKATVNLKFVQGMTYKVVFWAQAPGAYAPEFGDTTATVAMNYGTANNEAKDAFYAVEEIIVNGPANRPVELFRPFAQLNVGTSDLAKAIELGFSLSGVKVETQAFTSLDLISGAPVGSLTPVTFEAATIATTEKLNGSYDWLSFNYLLVGKEKHTLDEVKVTISNEYGNARIITESGVPVKRNYRTNLVGSLLTTDNGFNVELVPAIKDIPGYPTAKDKLISVATNGGTLTLEEDVDLDSTLTIASNVVLNLNGKTISGDWAKADGPVIKVNEGVTLTISNGTVSSTAVNGGSAIVNNGTTTLEDVTINGAPIQDGGWPSYGINNYGTLTVNGADITTYHGAIATGGDGVTVVNDATIDVGNSTETNQTSWALYSFENGQLTVNGGTYSNTKDEYGQVYGGGYICASSTKETIINGGTFDKTEADNNGSGFYYNCQNLVVKGGTFDVNPPAAYLADGYAAADNGNGTWTVGKALTATNAAEVFSNLSTTEPTTIAVTEDLTTTEPLVVPAGAEVTLNLGGNTLEGALTRSAGPVLENSGTLTVVGGTVMSTAANGAAAIVNNGTLTIEDVTIEGAPSDLALGYASYAVSSQGANSQLTVINSDISGRGAIAATGGTKVEVNGGDYYTPAIAWGHAVYASDAGTEIVINGGKFHEGYADQSNAWGMYQIYAGDGSKVTVNGGDFSEPWDCANGYDLATGGTGVIEIYGGVFADDPSNQNGKNYVATGKTVVDNGNDTWTVQ